MSTHSLEPVTRPNGKVYTPRKAPVAQRLDWDDHSEVGPAVLVLRTHDVTRAHALAMKVEKVEPVPSTVSWFRLMMRNGEQEWLADSNPGSWPADRGVPGVLFDVVDL